MLFRSHATRPANATEAIAQISVSHVESPVSESTPKPMAAAYAEAWSRPSASSIPCLSRVSATKRMASAASIADGRETPDRETDGGDHEFIATSDSLMSFSGMFPNTPPYWMTSGGNTKDALHSIFSDDEYHGMGFNRTGHDAVVRLPGPRAGNVTVEYGLVIVAYGVEEHSRMTFTLDGIPAVPLFSTMTSIHVCHLLPQSQIRLFLL